MVYDNNYFYSYVVESNVKIASSFDAIDPIDSTRSGSFDTELSTSDSSKNAKTQSFDSDKTNHIISDNSDNNYTVLYKWEDNSNDQISVESGDELVKISSSADEQWINASIAGRVSLIVFIVIYKCMYLLIKYNIINMC